MVAAFVEKLVHFLAFVDKVGVATTEAPQSNTIHRMERHFLGVVGERTNVANIVMSICWFVVYGSR